VGCSESKNDAISQLKLSKLFFIPQIEPPAIYFAAQTSFALGKGSYGTCVYVGVMEDGSEVAVKRMLAQAAEPLAQNERDILNRSADTEPKSPYVVSYRHFLRDNDFMYLILDLCEETLQEHVHSQTDEHIREHGPRMIKEILIGLEFLHGLGILHRDLKPSNVLLDVDGHMRLADFGISRVLEEGETKVYTDAKGTHDWIPSEVIEALNQRVKGHYKKKSDVHVVGMIGYFILTKGEHPFGSSSLECMQNILKGDPVNLKKLHYLDAQQFIAWLISRNINDRPYAHEALEHRFMVGVKEYEVRPKLVKRQ
jgi:serine/threonine protein kinase